MNAAANDLEVRQMLGELLAGQRALNDKIDHNHIDAGRQWEWIGKELSTIKHDARGVEMKVEGLYRGQGHIEEKLIPLEKLPTDVDRIDRRLEAVEVVNERVEKMEERIGSIEQVAWKIGFVVVSVWSVLALAATVASHFAGDILKWIKTF